MSGRGPEPFEVHGRVRRHRGLVNVESRGDVAVIVTELGLGGLDAYLAVDRVATNLRNVWNVTQS